jgi:glycerol-3-phosphate dehydrogenase (NAD(P)+)
MDHDARHERARGKGVNLFVYWLVRIPLQTFFHVYLRMQRRGRDHIPASGPAIIAANHRSFFDPFIIGTMARRPMYYVAKRELFEMNPILAWLLNALGAFPVDRGAGDTSMIDTVKELLGRGELVLIFPEGTRTRPGGLGRARRGVGRLALETGVPVVPVAIIGTEAIRRGRTRCACAPDVRWNSPARSRRRPLRPRSPSVSGHASSCSGSGSAGCAANTRVHRSTSPRMRCRCPQGSVNQDAGSL